MDILNRNINNFNIGEEVSNFFLYTAFCYAHEAAIYEVASDLFAEKIMNIDPDPNWQTSQEFSKPKSLIDWINKKEILTDNCLDAKTIEKSSKAWYDSLDYAPNSNIKLSKNRQLNSVINVVGHSVNLVICLESILNRHLFIMRESSILSSEHYKYIDRSELMPKLLFGFKDEIISNQLNISRIKLLVKLRNNSVHYRMDRIISLSICIEDCLGIWLQFGNILE